VLSPTARDALRGYHWPGNVRELENIIERAVVLEKGGSITPASLPLPVREAGGPAAGIKLPEGAASLTDTIEELERQLIVRALQDNGGSQTAAAASLGLKRSTLRYKLEKYGLVSSELGE
jgi:DNA-binding NtrC family response regulator